MGFNKLTNRYLGIHTDGLKCLNLWQMVAKIIEEYFSKSVTVTQITQGQKILTFGVSKIFKWILRHVFRWIQLSKAVTNDA